MSDPAMLSLAQAAEAIRARKLSSVEATRALLKRIGTWQPKLNAFVRIDADEALRAAKAADDALAKSGPKGPLHGVPLAHKDMYYIKGKPAGCGSKVLAAASTVEAEVRAQVSNGGNKAAAEVVGKLIAERAKAAGIEAVAFDRSGFQYHGRVKALADAAREGGLKF